MKPGEPRSKCPISYTLDLFGDKWSLLVMRDLLVYGKNSFGEFLNSEEKIATNILTDRLNGLINAGIAIKKVSPTNKSKYLYFPTQKGIDLIPILCEIAVWAEKYNPLSEPMELTDNFRKDKAKTIESMQQKFAIILH